MQLICLLIDWLLELGRVVKKQMEDMLKAFKVILVWCTALLLSAVSFLMKCHYSVLCFTWCRELLFIYLLYGLKKGRNLICTAQYSSKKGNSVWFPGLRGYISFYYQNQKRVYTQHISETQTYTHSSLLTPYIHKHKPKPLEEPSSFILFIT